MIEYRNLRVALLGGGTVGGRVAEQLLLHSDDLARRVGARLELVGIAVRNLDAKRSPAIPRELYTTDAESLILGADLVIELMGGIEPAKSYIELAISSGADVITANKALLAAHGPELFAAADRVGAQLYYEAAVAGAIPIIRPLSQSLAGDRISRVMGIVNGTTNFILDRMSSHGDTLESALATATELGYAEADPTADIGGYDAAQKAALLARLAFHTAVPIEAVYREGIESLSLAAVSSARRDGYETKLLAVCEQHTDASGTPTGVSARVYPALIPISHPLASVHGAYNAVFVEADGAGDLMFYGAGAGGPETASAVLGDLVSAARRHVAGGPGVSDTSYADLELLDIGQITTRYRIILTVSDTPGTLAAIATVFSDHGVSLETVEQNVRPQQNPDSPVNATLVIGTHSAQESALAATVAALSASGAVRSVDSVLRVEGAPA